MNEKEQIARIQRMLTSLHVPAGQGYPEINMRLTGPVSRIAAQLYKQGMRVPDKPMEKTREKSVDELVAELNDE